MEENGARGYAARWRAVRRRALMTACFVAVLVLAAVSGSIAWLVDSTGTLTNTFTAGKIDIVLEETKEAFKMVPGNEIDKDSTVTVKAGSEACWLFVKVESDNLDAFITWEVAPGWQKLAGHPQVYWREVASSAVDQSFGIIGYTKAGAAFVPDKVLVKDAVTKEDMQSLSKAGASQPTLKVTAYAVQRDNIPSAAGAWEKIAP